MVASMLLCSFYGSGIINSSMIFSRFLTSSDFVIGSFKFSVSFYFNWFRLDSGDYMFTKTFAYRCPVGLQFYQFYHKFSYEQ